MLEWKKLLKSWSYTIVFACIGLLIAFLFENGLKYGIYGFIALNLVLAGVKLYLWRDFLKGLIDQYAGYLHIAEAQFKQNRRKKKDDKARKKKLENKRKRQATSRQV